METKKTTRKTTTVEEPTVKGWSLPSLGRATGRSQPSATMRVQTLLGLFRIYLKPDGFYGPKTVRAVEEFQATVKLPITGEVGQRDWELLLTYDLSG